MKRALIVTVGTGTRPDVYIVKPLVKSIRDSRPDFLVLVVTEDSRTYGEAIIKKLELSESSWMMNELKDFDDFQAVFRSINQIFLELNKMGFCDDEIQLDFTSGTKAMSSGAVLSAIYNQSASIKYITGQRKNGVVINDTEKFITICPNQIFALHDMRLVNELILQLRFATADDILGKLRSELLNEDESKWAECLRLISQAYLAWDNFDHKNAFVKMRKVDWNLPALEPFRPSTLSMDLLENLAKGVGSDKNDDLLLDLFNNAVRRGYAGKYDDAVARLYRSAELFAQQILAGQYGIQSGNIDLSLVPDNMKSQLEKQRNDRDGIIRIGMEMDYSLLNELNHQTGRIFLNDKQLKGRLNERNVSILAHGLNPVTKRLYTKLRTSLIKLFESEKPDFMNNARNIQFPWLKEK